MSIIGVALGIYNASTSVGLEAALSMIAVAILLVTMNQQ